MRQASDPCLYRLAGAQNTQISMALVLTGIAPTSAHIGGSVRAAQDERRSRSVSPNAASPSPERRFRAGGGRAERKARRMQIVLFGVPCYSPGPAVFSIRVPVRPTADRGCSAC
jgi:hypothetical protein